MSALKPIRLFLSPSGRSPLSPKILNVKNQVAIENVAKRRLSFPCVSPKQTTTNNLLSAPIFEHNKLVDYEIYNKEIFVINTPNKLKILNHGLRIIESDFFVLGKGTFGTVIRGSYKGKETSVKVVKSKPHLNEINSLLLNHKNIVKTLDLIIKDELHSIIIMEYLHNCRELQSIIDDDSIELSLFQIVSFCRDICNGLQHCHQKNVLHLDLKPANVLVSDGICKICDFGNSVIVGGQCKLYKNGTVQYTAPEIFLGRFATFSSDIYSLGIVFWQLRYREVPYRSLGCKDSIIYKVVKYGIRPNSVELFKETDDSYAKLYRSCWESDERSRPTLQAVIHVLNDLV